MWQQINRNPHATLAGGQELDCGDAWHNAQMCRWVEQHFVLLALVSSLSAWRSASLYFKFTQAELLIYYFPPACTHKPAINTHRPFICL